MWRVSIEAGEAYSGPYLIPGDNDGRAGYSTGGEFVNFHHNPSIIINHSTFFYLIYTSTLLTCLLFGIIASLYFFLTFGFVSVFSLFNCFSGLF